MFIKTVEITYLFELYADNRVKEGFYVRGILCLFMGFKVSTLFSQRYIHEKVERIALKSKVCDLRICKFRRQEDEKRTW